MAVKKIYIGSFGPALYDDTDDVGDPDGDFSGKKHGGLVTDGDADVGGAVTVGSLKLNDTDDSNTLEIKWNENASADYVLNLLVGGGTRSLTFNENFTIGDGSAGTLTFGSACVLTVELASVLNQDLTTDASPTFGMLTVDAAAALILLHDSGTNVGHYIMSSDTTESSGYGEFSIWRCTGAADACVLGDNPPLMWADNNLNVSFPKAVTLGYFGGDLTVHSNIVVNGTVDGIDIATDVAANTAKVTCNFANVQTALAAASGAVDFNSQNLTSVGTVGCGNITGGTYNALTLTAAAVGFTIAGGTTSKTLTVDETASLSDYATNAEFDSHHDRHDPNDGADALDCAAAAEISVVVAADEGSAHSFARSDHVHAINHAITDNHIVTIDGTANANEHAVFTASGIAGLTDTELIAALSGDAGAAFDWNGQNLTGLGTLASAAGTLTIDETKSLSHYLLADGSRALGGRWDMFADIATDRWEDTDSNTYFGIGVAGAGNASGARLNAFFGNVCGYSITSGDGNIAVGAYALYLNQTGSDNMAIGRAALYTINASQNVGIGRNAGFYNATGTYNVYIGNFAGEGVTGNSNSYNTFIGAQAGRGITTGETNIGIGQETGKSITTGSSNTYIGEGAGYYNQTGSWNVLIGKQAGCGATGNSFAANVFVGYRSGYAATTGGNNICIGYQAGDVLTTGSGNIVIGYDIDPSAADAANEVNIGGVYKGDTSTTVPQFGTYAALNGESVVGYITIKDLAGNDRKVAVVA